MCNCDHMAMRKLHAVLIREGTCCTASCCDYCIVGDKNPIAGEYELVTRENGLLVSVRRDAEHDGRLRETEGAAGRDDEDR